MRSAALVIGSSTFDFGSQGRPDHDLAQAGLNIGLPYRFPMYACQRHLNSGRVPASGLLL